MTLPRISVIAMGGTIAGAAASSLDSTGYRAGALGVAEMLASVPELASIAEITGEQFVQIDSSDLTDELLIALAKRVTEVLADPEVDGIVITHGTDTLEESAYFLHLTVRSSKPLVVVGSMRPATALSADGPRNMFSAVSVAASPDARGQGVLVVMNDEIHTARDVTKSSSMQVGAFESAYGPLGAVINGRALFYRSVLRPHTVDTEFDLGSIETLPTSVVVYAHSGMDAAALDTIDRYDVIVHAGFGNGTVAARVINALDAARHAGSLVVRATRTGSGHVTVIGASNEIADSWVAVDDQNPQRARLLACLALTTTSDASAVQRIFHSY